jgi:pimeloyl-ACP methyl ester carboxylesterase
MLRGVLRTVRYARSWTAGADVRIQETEFVRDGVVLPATLVLPARPKGAVPGWIALGGISRMGRFHPQLVRFANALASSGAAVLIPEIPEWQNLKVSPGVAAPTIRGAIDVLEKHPAVRPGKIGLIGFSFGAPQVAISAARQELAGHVGGIVLFGGYCSLERTVRCLLTGGHEWEGIAYQLSPDPYGRWVLGFNHLTSVPGYEDAVDVAAALYSLAAAASNDRVSAWEPYHDKMIKDLRVSLPQNRRALFDVFATPTTGERPDRDECLEMAAGLTAACQRAEPMLDPGLELAGVTLPTQLIHGRGDRLIPFTEGMRLMQTLPEAARQSLTVTGLFGHSADRAPLALGDRMRERATFFGTLRTLINTV